MKHEEAERMLFEETQGIKEWKIAFNIVFYLSTAILVIMTLLLVLPDLNVMGFSVLRVVTASMEPELPRDSLILIRQDEANNLEIGQIATYMDEEDGFLRTLRILYIEKDDDGNNVVFKFGADAVPNQTYQVVSSDNIVGRVVFVSYAIGQTLLFLHSRFLLLIFTTISLLVVKLYVSWRSR